MFCRVYSCIVSFPLLQMSSFPIGIEDHLKEVGFNPTEILILRNVLQGQHYTLRELASKTGKSTGLLDQGMKRLLKRSIITKIHINNRSKYTLQSVHSLSQYIQQYFTNYVSIVRRRSQDVSAFFNSLTIENTRPSMEYFDGEQGIESLYSRLKQELQPGEVLQSYMPITQHIQTSYSECLEQFAIFRRKQNIPMQILTHNTLEARRYKSTDALYLRTTRFIEPDRCLLYIEHLLSESAYCCINYQNNTAQMIVFKELVDAKRSIFTSLWQDAKNATHQSVAEQSKAAATLESASVQ
jgi:DNA-binding transcriptional regulator GbsR (MarR family)